MKRIICLLMIVIMALSLAGCGGSAPSKPTGTTGSNTVQNVLDQQIKDAEATESENAPAETQKPASAESNTKPDESKEEASYDVDLTKLSSTMIYSEVYNMMSEPEKYIGKSVRMSGQFAFYQPTDPEGNPIPDQIYFACVIPDATACCLQGMEFVLVGEYIYPDDYPGLGDDIVVSGVFKTYEENGYMYCHLVDAILE